MKALMFTGQGTVQLAERDAPDRAEGETLMAPRFVGLCGTDLELYTGVMPYFAQGVARYPIQPGHEVAGIVVESSAPDLAPGTPVIADPVVGCGVCLACRSGRKTHCVNRYELGVRCGMPGGACELVSVPTRNLHRVPDGVALEDAVLVEPGVTACNAVDRCGDVASCRALVIGAGTLGLIATQLLASAGADVDVMDVEPARRTLIEEAKARPIDRVADATYDVVVEAAGVPRAVRDALSGVAPGGQVALIGVQSAPVDGVDVNLLVLKDATVFGVLNGPGLYDRLLGRIADGSVSTAMLVDARFPLIDATAALVRLAESGRARPKVLLAINGSLR